ncbi:MULTISPECIES: hypothetical protein [Streptomyces]|uniref:hypothetical protein n=1 Tax=Streptomyces TaxID=1883 RepID=UPI001489FF84|nr:MULTISPECIES: hypothetical protein [Streptomyces]
MPSTHLTEFQSIPTSGARGVEPFDLDGLHLLAIPQLAYDVPGTPVDMNGGDSDTDLLLLKRGDQGYEPFQRVSLPGGEDAEFFRIGDRSFLAVASIRTGKGPYRFAATSRVLEWDGSSFVEFQSFDSFAAKQWKHFTIEDRHFLALAQGVVIPGQEDDNLPSPIFVWDGERFVHFQDIDSQWAYNWHAFAVDGRHFLAHAEHVGPSVLYRFDGEKFQPHQELADRHGRAFVHFAIDGDFFLLVARLQSESQLLRWDGSRFVVHQTLHGLGAREFAVVPAPDGTLYVVRVNFVLGTPADPTTDLDSEIYQWRDGQLVRAETFPTTGATDVAVIHDDEEGLLIAVSHSLTADVRFAARTVLYRFTP